LEIFFIKMSIIFHKRFKGAVRSACSLPGPVMGYLPLPDPFTHFSRFSGEKMQFFPVLSKGSGRGKCILCHRIPVFSFFMMVFLHYETGVAAVISNMANIASHGGKVRHIPDADLFSVMLRCHDPNGEVYFLSIARNRVTLSSYSDDRIRKQVEKWTDGEPALA
jgi:hypothetical protein